MKFTSGVVWIFVCSTISFVLNELLMLTPTWNMFHPLGGEQTADLSKLIVFSQIQNTERQTAVRANMEKLGFVENENWFFFFYESGAKKFGPACPKDATRCHLAGDVEPTEEYETYPGGLRIAKSALKDYRAGTYNIIPQAKFAEGLDLEEVALKLAMLKASNMANDWEWVVFMTDEYDFKMPDPSQENFLSDTRFSTSVIDLSSDSTTCRNGLPRGLQSWKLPFQQPESFMKAFATTPVVR